MEALITTLLILFVINAINKKYTQTNNDTNKTQNKKSFAQQLSNTIEQIDKKQGKDGDFWAQLQRELGIDEPPKKPKTHKNNKTKSAKLANKKEALRDNYVGSIKEKSHEGEESSEGKGSSEGECMMQDAHKDLHKSIPDEQDPYANSNIQTLVENLDSNSIVQGFIMSQIFERKY